ncbi:MAG: hypothetical protein LBV71_14400 [Prevotella sp.]|jgi:hypothetical protein|nr:hypothetical protein [Prevotella sp.]
MKLYKNKLFAVILTVVAVVTFSSCSSDDDYEWRRGTLNLSTEFDKDPIYTDNKGRFSFSYDLRAEDIGGIDARRLDIVDVRSIESEVFLFYGELFVAGDHVNIRLSADGVNSRTLRMIVDNDKEAKVIDADYHLLQEFMSDMAYNLARRGQLNFYIDGELLDIPQQTYFDFEVKNIFDFEIRY